MTDPNRPSSPAVCPPQFRLDGGSATLVMDLSTGLPTTLYWGPRLPAGTALHTLPALHRRPAAPNSPFVEAPLGLTPLAATGFAGPPGLAGHRDGQAWAPLPRLIAVAWLSTDHVRLTSRDDRHALTLMHDLAIDPDTGVLALSATITNDAATPYALDHLAAPVLPIGDQLTRLLHLSGRWALEFQADWHDFPTGAFVRENRRGRTSHDAFPGLVCATPGTGWNSGTALGFHLGASGNHRLRAERLSDGRALIEMAELLLPGEIRLERGEGYTTPTLYAAVSTSGLNGIAQGFQRYVRTHILPTSVAERSRPVHYNSWEAVYFNHDQPVLRDLAAQAAALGVERFVLDDGWFGARRNSWAGLGDWTVSPDVYPDGITPLIDHVRDLGMTFGLWVEPEMVNPDSDLYRAHPDWVLGLAGVDQVPMRQQYVLDLARTEVADHLFARLDALLRDHAIDYLKWDMNRDLSQPGGADGRAAAHVQAGAVHALIDRLRAAHPAVEIESCASGGGRANYEILKRTHRIWTSDSNDALDRLTIQRGCGLFFPPEIMGAHVGPRDCHSTGRRMPMAMRAGVALFGHMGLEMDLRELTDAERTMLGAAIALHKAHRALLHHGELHRIDTPAHLDAFGVIAADRGTALFSYAVITQSRSTQPERIRLTGLDPMTQYRVDTVWPPGTTLLENEGAILPGALLMHLGLPLPLMHPQSLHIVHVTRV